MSSILNKKNTKLTKVIFGSTLSFIVLWVLVKPQIDNYFDEVNSEIAIKTCGGKEKVKNTTSEGFECK